MDYKEYQKADKIRIKLKKAKRVLNAKILKPTISPDTIIVNLCPHIVKCGTAVADSRGVLRVDREYRQIGDISGFPIFEEVFTKTPGMVITKKKNTIYIVSLITAKMYPSRSDFYVVQNGAGLVGSEVAGLCRNPYYLHKNSGKL